MTDEDFKKLRGNNEEFDFEEEIINRLNNRNIEKIWMGDFKKGEIELFPIDEKECFDIDYEWEFKNGNKLYK